MIKENILSAEAIHNYASENFKLLIFDVIDSTNSYLKSLNNKELEHGMMVIANTQTSGRGRKGRSFFSPIDSGLYLSIYLKPDHLSSTQKTTIGVAVACIEAIQSCSNTKPRIKWVNDIFLDNKKIGGILCETTYGENSIIVGVGLNCFSTQYPEELSEIAGAINDTNLSRNKLAAYLRKRILYWCDHLDDKNLIKLYTKYSLIVGKEILFTINGENHEGKAIDIKEDGSLLVDSCGNLLTLQSGEVSIKKW